MEERIDSSDSVECFSAELAEITGAEFGWLINWGLSLLSLVLILFLGCLGISTIPVIYNGNLMHSSETEVANLISREHDNGISCLYTITCAVDKSQIHRFQVGQAIKFSLTSDIRRHLERAVIVKSTEVSSKDDSIKICMLISTSKEKINHLVGKVHIYDSTSVFKNFIKSFKKSYLVKL